MGCELLDVAPREGFATEILPWLYLGDAQDAVNHDAMRPGDPLPPRGNLNPNLFVLILILTRIPLS